MKYSIIIPAYNEEAAIKKAVEEVTRYFYALAPGDFEIIIIDDGSRDRTAEITKNLLSSIPEMRLLKNEVNFGKGYSVRRGILAASGEYTLFLDADMSTPVSEFEKFKDYLSDYDIIIGSRAIFGAEIIKSQPRFKAFCGRLAGFCIRLILGLNIKDTQCGFKLFSRRAKEIFCLQKINRWGFDAEILFLARRKGFRIKEVPIRWINDETSSVKPVDYIKSFFDILKIRRDYFIGKYNNFGGKD